MWDNLIECFFETQELLVSSNDPEGQAKCTRGEKLACLLLPGSENKMDEPALLHGARKLDQVALATIFDKYAPAIYKYCFRLSHDAIESDNIVGDVFAELFEKLTAGQGPLTNLRSYLYQIAYHRLIDHIRYNQQMTKLEIVNNAQDKLAASSVQSEVEDRFLLETLLSALNTDLSEIQQHVIFLRFFEDFSLRETALIIGKSVNNVKVIQNRAIAKLRKSLRL
jgi:RNA polymerase sigma-70 factor (ECF subfamily)